MIRELNSKRKWRAISDRVKNDATAKSMYGKPVFPACIWFEIEDEKSVFSRPESRKAFQTRFTIETL